jgi:hypothetical protein
VVVQEHELDVLGLTDDGLVAGECTFTLKTSQTPLTGVRTFDSSSCPT